MNTKIHDKHKSLALAIFFKMCKCIVLFDMGLTTTKNHRCSELPIPSAISTHVQTLNTFRRNIQNYVFWQILQCVGVMFAVHNKRENILGMLYFCGRDAQNLRLQLWTFFPCKCPIHTRSLYIFAIVRILPVLKFIIHFINLSMNWNDPTSL